MTNNALVKFMESIFRDRIKIWNYFFQSKFQKIRSVSAELEISLPKSPGCFTIYYPKNKTCQLVPHERLWRIREITYLNMVDLGHRGTFFSFRIIRQFSATKLVGTLPLGLASAPPVRQIWVKFFYCEKHKNQWWGSDPQSSTSLFH